MAGQNISALSSQYESLQSADEKVIHTAGAEAEQSASDELADIERPQLDTDSQMTEKSQLESTSRLWDEVQARMGGILEQLKKTQAILAQPLSGDYDELERELRYCQVCSVSSQKLLTRWLSFFSNFTANGILPLGTTLFGGKFCQIRWSSLQDFIVHGKLVSFLLITGYLSNYHCHTITTRQ